jgi:hypothetical protein
VLIDHKTYERLYQAAVITRMTVPTHHIEIGFGTIQDGTHEVVIGIVQRPGFLLDEILVVMHLVSTLIGDDAFTDKGLWLLKNNECMMCIFNRSVVAMARRDTNTGKGALWLMDFAALCGVPDPRLRARQTITLSSVSAEMHLIDEVPPVVCEDDETDEEDGPILFGPVHVVDALTARQTRYPPAVVREAERTIARSMIGARTIADIFQAQAWSNIPPHLSPALIRAVADKRENIPYILTHSKSARPEASGISPPLGHCMYMDIWGKYPVGVTGTCFIVQMGDVFSSYGKLYAVKGKGDLYGAMTRFAALGAAYGHDYKEIWADCASEVKGQFELAANKAGLVVRKAAPEQFGVGPAERNTQC